MPYQQFVMERLTLLLCIVNHASLQEFFTQKLDHFNPSNKAEWQQRYWKTNEFYQPNGPVFLWIYGVEAAQPDYMTIGQMSVYAENLGALCFTLEHRFFGESKPTKDTSLENLVYLTSEQAIEDVAEFIKSMNKINQLPSQTKWFAFGGSYGAAMAAWCKLKHPELIYGCVASSATLLAKSDYPEYYRSVQSTLAAYNEKCPITIQKASDEIRESFKTEAGRKNLTQTFQLCTTLANNPIDLSNLFVDLADQIAEVVQFNKVNVDLPIVSITVDKICDLLIRENVTPISSFAEVIKLILGVEGTPCINPVYQTDIDSQKLIGFDKAENSGRLWQYVACTWLGSFATSSQPSDLFGISFDVDFLAKDCLNIFGEKFDLEFVDDAMARTNKNYGGLNINVNNTVFVYGTNDPWHFLGITEAQSGKLYEVIRIEGAASCSDIYAPTEEDSAEVKAAREKILNLLRSWITT